MLVCPCGTRLEVDDALAGQMVFCPECRQLVRASVLERSRRVTSGWALASVVLALIGAFTVVGTVLAVVAGVIALVSITRQRHRLAGIGFAVLGICLGALFTVLTVVALNAGEMFGLEEWLREHTLASKIDTSGPLEIVQQLKGFAITRPSEKWGQVPDGVGGDPAVRDFQEQLDLLLMPIGRHAFIDVRVLPAGLFQSLDQCEAEILMEFEKQPPRRDPFRDAEEDDFHLGRGVRRLSERRLGAKDGMEGRELEAEVRCAGKPWRFLIRLYRRDNGRIYVVRAYVPRRRLVELRSELEAGLDSFRILPP